MKENVIKQSGLLIIFYTGVKSYFIWIKFIQRENTPNNLKRKKNNKQLSSNASKKHFLKANKYFALKVAKKSIIYCAWHWMAESDIPCALLVDL